MVTNDIWYAFADCKCKKEKFAGPRLRWSADGLQLLFIESMVEGRRCKGRH